MIELEFIPTEGPRFVRRFPDEKAQSLELVQMSLRRGQMTLYVPGSSEMNQQWVDSYLHDHVEDYESFCIGLDYMGYRYPSRLEPSPHHYHLAILDSIPILSDFLQINDIRTISLWSEYPERVDWYGLAIHSVPVKEVIKDPTNAQYPLVGIMVASIVQWKGERPLILLNEDVRVVQYARRIANQYITHIT